MNVRRLFSGVCVAVGLAGVIRMVIFECYYPWACWPFL